MKNLLELILLWMLLLSFGKQGVMCEFNFSFTPDNRENFISTGKASFTRDGVALTTGGNSEFGRLFYKYPLQFSNSTREASFTTFFSFRISNKTNQGDGIAFCLMPSINSPAGSGKYLGMVNQSTDGRPDNHLFGVEFDSYANEEEQSLGQHIGIDVNSIRSVANRSLPLDLNFYFGFTLYAWIDYNGTSNTVQVGLSRTSFEEARVKILLNKALDVDLGDVLLEQSYIGLSASTGLTNDVHSILSWNFSSQYVLRQFHAQERSRRGTCKLHLPIISPIVIAFIIAMVLLGYYTCKRRRILYHPTSLVHYSYSFLYTATKGFGDKQLLGRGGFGKVYKATTLSETLAVKVVGNVTEETEHQFVAELITLSEYQHKNLVRLRGWCHAKRKLMLVYDYMSNGSLADHIFQDNTYGSSQVLTSWSLRYGILQGVAQGVLFLHEGKEDCILHRDIKAANVLLDSDFTPKLGDFGLARLLDKTDCSKSMTVAGTFGYVAPEVAYKGRVTTRSDVYSFGILCLEVVTGRRTLDARFGPDVMLLDWIWHMQERGSLMETVDKRMKFDKEQVRRVLHMAMGCCSLDSNCRPTMKECWEVLNGTHPPPVPPARRPDSFISQRSSSSAGFSTHSSLLQMELTDTMYMSTLSHLN